MRQAGVEVLRSARSTDAPLRELNHGAIADRRRDGRVAFTAAITQHTYAARRLATRPDPRPRKACATRTCRSKDSAGRSRSVPATCSVERARRRRLGAILSAARAAGAELVAA